MRVSIRVGAAALAAAFSLLAGAPALAQAPAGAPPSAEQVRLGVQFAGQMLDVLDLNAIMARSLTTSLADGDFGKIEPRWKDFFVEAMGEEIKADHAAIVATMGRAFARNFTADELQAGLTVFRDPAMATVMRALSAGQPAPAGVNLQPATLQAMASPAGRGFQTKFGNLEKLMDSSKSDLIHVLVPGFFQRFGEKAVALERQRRQAEGLPAAGG